MSKSIIPPRSLSQKAKQIKKANPSLKHSQALDEAAKELGYSNYKSYLNLQKDSHRRKAAHFKDIFSENDMFKKMDLAISFIINFKVPFSEQLKILKLFQSLDNLDDPYDLEMQAVCEKLKLDQDLRYKDYGVQPYLQYVCENLDLAKDDIQSYLFEEFQEDMGDIPPYFITNDISITNLIYDIAGDILCVDGDYNQSLKFDFENFILENEEDRNDERFNDREISGSFGVEIDRNKKITLIHSDM